VWIIGDYFFPFLIVLPQTQQPAGKMIQRVRTFSSSEPILSKVSNYLSDAHTCVSLHLSGLLSSVSTSIVAVSPEA